MYFDVASWAEIHLVMNCLREKIFWFGFIFTPTIAFISDWQPSPCQDGRHGQADKAGQAGLPHPRPGIQGNYSQVFIAFNLQILRSFSAPITEEHAWAVIHQVFKLVLAFGLFVFVICESSSCWPTEVIRNFYFCKGCDHPGGAGGAGGPTVVDDWSRPVISDQGWTGGWSFGKA